METTRQIYFRKYGEHIRECEQCKSTPRSLESMCELGRTILITYRDSLTQSLGKLSSFENSLGTMSSEEVVHVLEVLTNKTDKTVEDEEMIDALNQVVRNRIESVGRATEAHWKEHAE